MKRLLPILVLVAILGGVAWFLIPRRIVRERHLTLNEAAHELRLGLPPSASNILFASASVGLGGRATLYRFTAPLSNMLAHVEFLDSTRDYPRDASTPPPYEPIQAPVEKPNLKPYGLHKINWFDVENIRTGYVTHVGGYNSTIWIDAGRNLYFYHWSD